MIITRKSPVTGKMHSREVDVTHEQLAQWNAGSLIQDVMPHLSPEEREFIISGCTPEDFNELFPEEGE